MSNQKFRTIFILILSAFFVIFLLKSFSPFGLKAIYSFEYPKSNFIKNIFGLDTVLDLGKTGDREIKHLELSSEKASFTLVAPPSPKPVTKAKISIDFRADKEAKISIGNNSSGETKSVTFFEPTIQSLLWESLNENGLTLYQKNKKYDSINNFLEDPDITSSDGKNIALYNYKIKPVIKGGNSLGDSFETNSKLRGGHTFYTYVDNNKLKIDISKIDLNQYQGSDSINITVFYDDEEILHETIEDDGINDDSSKITQSQEKSIEKISENGIYKISIDGGIDSVITNIKVNQKLVVFDRLFLVDNPAIYTIADSYKTNTVYTDSKKINFTLGHESQKQDIKINNNTFEIDQKNKTIDLDQSPITGSDISKELNVISSEINDMEIHSESVLAFNRENFFRPYLSKTVDISPSVDVNSLNYIIGKYKKATEKNGWYHQDLEIPISPNLLENNELNFSIYTSDKSTSRKTNWLKIKDLKVTLE